MGTRVLALVAGLGVMGALLLVVPPAAQACGCGDRDVQAALDAGHAVAVVTRTDAGKPMLGQGDEAATFRLEAAIGPALPDRLTGVLDWCQGAVAPGGVEALVFQPARTVPAEDLFRFVDRGPSDPDALVIGICSKADLGEALYRIRGAPTTPGEGGAVALAWGTSKTARWLAALDSRGRVMAWDDHDGWNDAVGVCPGGEVAVVASSTDNADQFVRRLSVHEVPTLRTRREIALATEAGVAPRVLRCADPDGREIDVLAMCSGTCGSPAWLIRVRDGRTTTTPLTAVEYPMAVTDGFIGIRSIHEPVTGNTRSRIVRIAADGTRAALGQFSGHVELAASPDGRTIAVSGVTGLVTIDGRTGRRLARWLPPAAHGVTAIGWTSRGLLAVTHPPHGRPRKVPATTQLVVLDANLRPVARRADMPTGWRTVVADSLVTFNSGRLTVTPASGPTLEADELMLARASGVIGLPGGAFTPEAVGVRPQRTPIRIAHDGAGPSGPGAGVLALGTFAIAAIVLIGRRARARRGAAGQH